MVVPSQAPASSYASTHSFMDTNSIAHPHHTSSMHHHHPHQALPSLNTQLGVGLNSMHYGGSHHNSVTTPGGVAIPTLPSLPSLTNISWNSTSPSASGTLQGQPPSSAGPVESSWMQQTHVPMHLQPSPARLSPILGHNTNINLPPSNGIGGSANGLGGLTTPAQPANGPIPPSRYPIAADLNGLANAVRPQSSKGPQGGSAGAAINGNAPNGPTGSSGSSNTSGTPPPVTGSTAVSDHLRDVSPSRNGVGIIGQHVQGHYSQLSTGFLPAFVHSRASSPVPGESSMMNGGQQMGANNVPLTPSTAAEIFPAGPLYNWSMPYKDLESVGPQPSSDLQQTHQQRQQHQALLSSNLIHPPLGSFHKAHSLTTLAPMPLIMHIISLFFDFVYPLTPCVHKPR